MQVLELPGSQAVLGPGQVQGRFGSTAQIAQTVTLLNSQGSSVIYGNLLTLPVGDGLLYVEPLYVEAAGNPYPIRSTCWSPSATGWRSVVADRRARDVVRGGRGPAAPDAGQGNDSPSPTPSGSASASPSGSAPSSPAPGGGGGSISPELQSALNQLATAYENLQKAFKSGDVAAIGSAQTAVNQAAAAVAGLAAEADSGRRDGICTRPAGCVKWMKPTRGGAAR